VLTAGGLPRRLPHPSLHPFVRRPRVIDLELLYRRSARASRSSVTRRHTTRGVRTSHWSYDTVTRLNVSASDKEVRRLGTTARGTAPFLRWGAIVSSVSSAPYTMSTHVHSARRLPSRELYRSPRHTIAHGPFERREGRVPYFGIGTTRCGQVGSAHGLYHSQQTIPDGNCCFSAEVVSLSLSFLCPLPLLAECDGKEGVHRSHRIVRCPRGALLMSRALPDRISPVRSHPRIREHGEARRLPIAVERTTDRDQTLDTSRNMQRRFRRATCRVGVVSRTPPAARQVGDVGHVVDLLAQRHSVVLIPPGNPDGGTRGTYDYGDCIGHIAHHVLGRARRPAAL